MTSIGIILGLLTVMFLTFSMHMLWSRYEVLVDESKLAKLEIEGLRNRQTVTNARSLMCRNKLELVEDGLTALLVEKYSQHDEVTQ